MATEPLYSAIIGLVRAMFSFQKLDFTFLGEDNADIEGGAVLAGNHTGYLDFMFLGLPFRKHGRYVRFMAKKEAFDHALAGPIMRGLKHIPVDRIDGQASFDEAVAKLRAGELVGIFPEGTISRSFEVKHMRTGAVRMAAEAQVPVIPVVIFGSQRLWTKGQPKSLGRHGHPIYISIGKPWYPTGEDPEADTQRLREQMQGQLEELWERYRQDHGEFPQEAGWVPARLGGSAPALEDAEAQDKVVEDERYRVRRLDRDMRSLRESLSELTDKARSMATRWNPGEAASESVSELSAKADEMTTAVRSSLRELSSDVIEGLNEGVDRIRTSGDQLREGATEFFDSIPAIRDTHSYHSLEEGLTSLFSQARQICDALPLRARSHLKARPEALVIDARALPEECDSDVVAAVSAYPRCVLVTSELSVDAPFPVEAVVTADGAVIERGGHRTVHSFTPGREAGVAAVVRGILPDAELEWEHADGRPVRLLVRGAHTSPQVDDLSAALEELGAVVYPGEELVILDRESTRLAAVREILGEVPILAFGTSDADAELLKEATVGVALGDASFAALSAADWVTADAAEGGVAKVLEAFAAAEEQEDARAKDKAPEKAGGKAEGKADA